ncbi:MAG: DNA cytosine methyltransferase [Propionibacterium sp.]|nr:DNA cytosine methyltransferase [Propionibacterium sp.]
MTRPRLLDLFCGEGGAAAGYITAGFDVTGVDLNATVGRHYPSEFIATDALAYIATHGADFDAIHASPPCQGYTIATAGNPTARAKHQRLIAATRELLILTGRPWVIENVEQARRQMRDPILLCGRMFGLGADDEDGLPLVLDRHRLFESNVPILAPAHPKHGAEQVAGVYGGGRARKPGQTAAEHRYSCRHDRGGGYVPRSKAVKQALLGIDWMTVRGMQESIPPAYSAHVGAQLLAAIESRAAA